jgi:hypothetical protein
VLLTVGTPIGDANDRQQQSPVVNSGVGLPRPGIWVVTRLSRILPIRIPAIGQLTAYPSRRLPLDATLRTLKPDFVAALEREQAACIVGRGDLETKALDDLTCLFHLLGI